MSDTDATSPVSLICPNEAFADHLNRIGRLRYLAPIIGTGKIIFSPGKQSARIRFALRLAVEDR